MGATAIVLAAGMGKRMKSALPKVLHAVLGEPMLDLVLAALAEAGMSEPLVVVGHGAEEVRAHLGPRVRTALQAEQLGTGHAVKCALDQMPEQDGLVAVACGDTPLLSAEAFRALRECHEREGNAATVLTCVLEDPAQYGRIVRNAAGNVTGIIEFKDANAEQRNIREINSGTYFFDIRALRDAVGKLKSENAQKEYYLTDAVGIIASSGAKAGALAWPRFEDTLGVNSPAELAEAEEILGRRIQARHLAAGVRIESRSCVRIGPRAEIGAGTVLRGPLSIEGACRIGTRCELGPGMRIHDAAFPDGSRISPTEVFFGNSGGAWNAGAEK